MNLIDLRAAVVEIHQACDEAEEGHKNPFFFILLIAVITAIYLILFTDIF